MAATTKAKDAEYTGKPTKKSAAAPTFDIGAALAEETPGSNTGHYVAGSSVTSTEEAEAMEDMITEMQEEQAFEQELQQKGLRNIIGDIPVEIYQPVFSDYLQRLQRGKHLIKYSHELVHI